MFGKGRAAVIAMTVLVLAASLFATSAGRSWLSPVGGVIRSGLAPFQGAAWRLTRSVSGAVSSVWELWSLREDHARLQAEVGRLRVERDLSRPLERENRYLREALNFRLHGGHRMVAAEVIARSPDSWFSSLTIDKGRGDGTEPGMPVVAPGGVVGRIGSVTGQNALVMLITDPASAVGGEVARTGEPVLVEGTGESRGSALVRSLSGESTMQDGDLILTSGLSRIFPEGLVLGKVSSVRPGKYGLSRLATLDPGVDLSRLDVVFVVVGR